MRFNKRLSFGTDTLSQGDFVMLFSKDASPGNYTFDNVVIVAWSLQAGSMISIPSDPNAAFSVSLFALLKISFNRQLIISISQHHAWSHPEVASSLSMHHSDPCISCQSQGRRLCRHFVGSCSDRNRMLEVMAAVERLPLEIVKTDGGEYTVTVPV